MLHEYQGKKGETMRSKKRISRIKNLKSTHWDIMSHPFSFMFLQVKQVEVLKGEAWSMQLFSWKKMLIVMYLPMYTDNCFIYVNCVIKSHKNDLIFPLLLLLFVLNIRIQHLLSFYPVGAQTGKFIVLLVVYFLQRHNRRHGRELQN